MSSGRLQIIAGHLNNATQTPTTPPASQGQTSPPNTTISAMTAERDPITCHVLDTTTGRPGVSINVVLTPLAPFASQTSPLTATTNSDGRVMNWTSKSGDAGSVIRSLISECARKEGDASTTICPVGSSLWKLEFDTGNYYGEGKCFFPKVELTFVVKEGEHFHVPLLLGPYSFTTYRGS